MTYKSRAVKAIKEMMVDYEKGIYISGSCLLCNIYDCGSYRRCSGCPNYSAKMYFSYGGEMGRSSCFRFKTFQYIIDNGDFSPRLKFWQRALPRIEKIPAKYFTPSSWAFKPFVFMDDIDNEVMEEFNEGGLR